MKIHLVTVGKPKLSYAKSGWEEYLARLTRYHAVRITHLADKHAYDAAKFREVTKGSFVVGLIIDGQELSSSGLAEFLQERELAAREVSFVIGGPEGLPAEFREEVDYAWSFSKLTLPHDLAMVVLLEALYRATTINAGQPYHK